MESLEKQEETFAEKKERLEGSIDFLKSLNLYESVASSGFAVGTLMSICSYLTKQSSVPLEFVEVMMAAASVAQYLHVKTRNTEIIKLDQEYTTLTKYPGNCTQKREDTKLELERVNKNKNIGIGISIAALALVISSVIVKLFVSSEVPYDGYVEVISKDVIASILYYVGDFALIIGTIMARLNGLEQKVLKKRQRYLQ